MSEMAGIEWVQDPLPVMPDEELRQVQSSIFTVDEVREKTELPPWVAGEFKEPVVFTPEGPVPLSELPARVRKTIKTAGQFRKENPAQEESKGMTREEMEAALARQVKESSITREQLTQALKTVRFWIRDHREDDYARRGYILHPEDAARDIFTSVRVNNP